MSKKRTPRTRRPARRGPTHFEVSDLPTLGWLQITEIGEENIYFTLADGTKGFVKP